MSRMLNKIFILICVLAAAVSAGASDEIQITAINSYNVGDVFYTELNFSEPVSKDELHVEFINRTVQIDIKDVVLSKEKFYRKVNHDRVKSIYTYMPSPGLARARIIQKPPYKAEELLGHIELEQQGSRILVKVFNPTMHIPKENIAKQLPDVRPRDIDALVEAKGFVKSQGAKVDPKRAAESALERDLKFAENMAEAEQARLSTSVDKAIEKPREKAKEILAEKESEIPIVLNAEEEKSESEIPVFSSKKKQEKSSGESPWYRMLMSLVFIGVFGTGIAFAAKWWSGKKQKSLDNNKIRVLTRHHLGPKKELCVVQIAGESILLGVTDQNINMIKNLALFEEEIPEISNQKFSEALTGHMKASEREVLEQGPSSLVASREMPAFQDESSEPDEFAVHDVRDIIASRLKHMRDI